MEQELGRIERPTAEHFAGKRKLLLVPLVHGPQAQAQECQPILEKYWVQMQSQVASLESSLGRTQHLFHEGLTEGGAEGLKYLEAVDQRSYRFMQGKCAAGASLAATEDDELLREITDLQRCMLFPFTSENVAHRLHEWFSDSNRKRYEHISKRIEETLQENEVGLLLISERHQVQFPADVEVIYVAPSSLDEFRRCIQDWLAQQQKAAAEAAATEAKETQ